MAARGPPSSWTPGSDGQDRCSCSSDTSAELFADNEDRRLHSDPDGTFSLDIFSRDFTDSPIYAAIVTCSLPALFHAIYCLRAPATSTDANFGVNYLHLAVSTAEPATEAAFEAFVYALCNFRANPSQEDAGGDTPLRRALRRGLPAMARGLLRCGARQDSAADAAAIAEAPEDAVDQLRATCAQFQPGLWASVAANDYFLVDRLLGCWSRVRIARGRGGKDEEEEETLVGFARRSGASSLVVELLEGSRATLEFVHATLAGDARKMAQLLANRNVNTEVRDRGHRLGQEPRSLRDTAVAMGHRASVLRLLPDRSGVVGGGGGTRTPAMLAGGGRRPGTRPTSAVCGVM